MGRIYGTQWRRWRGADGQETTNCEAIALIKNNPDSRRLANAWNAAEAGATRLSYRRATLSSSSMSRAAGCLYRCISDQQICFLEFPLTSRATRSCCTCRIVCNLAPGEFIHTIGDAHIYLDAVIKRKNKSVENPAITDSKIVDRGQTSIDDFLLSDFKLQNYESMPASRRRWRCETSTV